MRQYAAVDYITFFVGIFEPNRRRLTYVNAGHNPPLIKRTNGAVESLDVGGLILGMMCDVHYEYATVDFSLTICCCSTPTGSAKR